MINQPVRTLKQRFGEYGSRRSFDGVSIVSAFMTPNGSQVSNGAVQISSVRNSPAAQSLEPKLHRARQSDENQDLVKRNFELQLQLTQRDREILKLKDQVTQLQSRVKELELNSTTPSSILSTRSKSISTRYKSSGRISTPTKRVVFSNQDVVQEMAVESKKFTKKYTRNRKRRSQPVNLENSLKMGCGWGKQNILNGKVTTRSRDGDNVSSKGTANAENSLPSPGDEVAQGSERNVPNQLPKRMDPHSSPGASFNHSYSDNKPNGSSHSSLTINTPLYRIQDLEYASYSSLGDWNKILKRVGNMKEHTPFNHITTPYDLQNSAILNHWDRQMFVDMPARLLSLAPRDWVKEWINLQAEKKRVEKSNQANISLAIDRQLLQITQHLRWLCWAVAAYYLVSLSDPEARMEDINGFEKLLKNSPESSTARDYLSIDLPKSSSLWMEGFIFKNVYFRLAYTNGQMGQLMKQEVQAQQAVVLSVEHQHQNSTYNLSTPQTWLVRFGPFSLFSTPVYHSKYLRTLVSEVEVPLFGRPKVTVPPDLGFLLAAEVSDGELPRILLINAYKLVPVVIQLQFVMRIPQTGPIVVTDQPVMTESDVVQAAKEYTGSANRSRVTAFSWDFEVFTGHGISNPRAQSIAQHAGGPTLATAKLGKQMMRRFPTIHSTDAEYTRWKAKAVIEIQKILEQSDNINSSNSMKELFKRKGLNMYSEWIVLARVRSDRARALLRTDLLARGVRDVVLHQCAWSGTRYTTETFKSLIVSILNQVLTLYHSKTPAQTEVMLCLFMKRQLALRDMYLMKRLKCEKKRQVVSLNLKHQVTPFESLQTDGLLKEVYESGSSHPSLFLNSLSQLLGIEWNAEWVGMARADYFNFLCQTPIMNDSHISRINMTLTSTISLREESYISMLHYVDPHGAYQAISSSYEVDSRIVGLDNSVSSFISGISVSDIEIQMGEEEEKIEGCNEILLPGSLYAIPRLGLFREIYEDPKIQVVQEWVNCLDPQLSQLFGPDGEETILIEALLLHIERTYFLERDCYKWLSNLRKAEDIINNATMCPAEYVIAYYMWNGIVQESINRDDAEASYITTLLLLNRLVGDPRGRAWRGVPWQMMAAWKLSQLSRSGGRTYDAHLADEFFDAAYANTKHFSREKLRRLNDRYARRGQGNENGNRMPFPHWASVSSTQDRDINSLIGDELIPGTFSSFYSWFTRHNILMYMTGVKWTNAEIKFYVHSSINPQPYISTSPSFVSTPSRFGERDRDRPACTLQGVLNGENGDIERDQLKGYVFVWGTDNKGQLGLDITKETSEERARSTIESDILSNAHSNLREEGVKIPVPRLQTYLKDLIIRDVSAGFDHCLAVTIEGRWYGWGNNEYSQLGLSEQCFGQVVSIPSHLTTVDRVKRASWGYQHSVLVTHDLTVYTMGNGEAGLLGNGKLEILHTPHKVRALEEQQIVAVECGAFHSIALSKQGGLFWWGRGDGGQLGLKPRLIKKMLQQSKLEVGEEFIVIRPEPIPFLDRTTFTQIAWGEAHTLALSTDNKVYGWGTNSNGQLGTGVCSENYSPGTGERSTTECEPILIESLLPYVVMSISAGGAFSSFITRQGEVLVWGNNNKGQLGIEIPHQEHQDVPFPTKLTAMTGTEVKTIYCGLHHAFAVSGEQQSMSLYAWGEHRYGQLGAGDRSKSTTRMVQGLGSTNIQKVACGGFFSVALVGSAANMYKGKTDSVISHVDWRVKFNEHV